MIAKLALSLTLIASASNVLAAETRSTTSLEPMIAGIERAVVVGSVDALETSRTELLQRLEASESTGNEERYLLAYVDWRLAGLMMASPKEHEDQRLEILEEAQAHLEALIEAAPEHAEAHALLGSVFGMQIGGSAFRGMRLGPRASAAIERAHQLEPDNPRVALARGIGWLNTPKMFGGGIEKADAELRRADELFQQESPTRPWPYWGRVDALIWRGRAEARQKQYDAARVLFERALTLEPDYGWIRYRLLPAIDSKQ